jgi:hypothetical protein
MHKTALIIAVYIVLTALPAFASAERYFALGVGGWLPGKTSTIDSNFLQADGNGIRRTPCL